MTRLVMISSALFMAVTGLAATFAPQEIAARLVVHAGKLLALEIQLLGALLLGFAMLNWMARESLIGGIYNRPVAIGNLMHFTIGALALVKGVLAGPRTTAMIVMAVLYALFAIAFGKIVFTSPVKSTPAS